jgi:hypothetical protein
LLALALGLLPLFRLTGQSLWFDELFTLFVARQPPGEMLRQAAADGFTPPLYYLLVGLALRAGLALESLRLVSAGFGLLALVGLLRLATRLFGSAAGMIAVALAGLSPFLVSMSQELRPYTAFLACAAFAADCFVRWRAEPGLGRGLLWVAWLLGAAAFSYLGLALVPLALLGAALAPRGRLAGLALALLALFASLLISLPGLHKAQGFYQSRSDRGRVQWETRDIKPLARLTLGAGFRPEPTGDARDRGLAAAAEWCGRAALLLAIGWAALRRDRPLAAAAGGLAAALLAVWTADAFIGIGVTTRYLSLAFIPFVLTLARLAQAAPRLGGALAVLVGALQLVALQRYLLDPAYARDDWRSLTARLVRLHEPDDVILGFPGHHVSVALLAYAPQLPLVGGFAGRPGEPVYLYKEGERFRGYDFDGQLEEVGAELKAALRRRTAGRRVRLVTYADDDWHGDTRPIADALAGGAVRSERFPARETLLIREFAAW